MKLSGYIQFPVNFCMGKVLISGLELKTGNWSFPEESTIFPCNIFLRFLFFRFELPTGNWNDDLALVHGQLYTTPKFHSNPSYSLWGEEGSTLKKPHLMEWLLFGDDLVPTFFHFMNSPIPNRISRSPRCVALTNVGTIKCSSNELNSSLAPFLSFILINNFVMIFLRIIRSKTP